MATGKEDTQIELQLTLDEVNTVIEALGHMPFMRVYRIIEKIHVQAQAGRQEKKTAKK